jgi:uncharacterized repeat protein (TIGR03806 family)
VAPKRPQTSGGVRLAPAYRNLRAVKPVGLVFPPRSSARGYLVEQGGRIQVFDDDENARSTVFADLSARVDSSASESGLLGLAFHPRYPDNRSVYVSYTARRSGQLLSRLSRFVANEGGLSLDVSREDVLLEVNQPLDNHNGGHIAFGPDGFLYYGLGDGGGAGDPQRTGQRTDTLLGKLLRLDVDGAAPYAIPADNPFARGGGRPEIFASGFRNPWRFAFDRTTGDLWLGDVGQDALEEINRVVRGGNYGWSIKEGTRCFGATACSSAGLIDPVAEYGRNVGVSITGGFVYRGQRIPQLRGRYVFGDFGSGRLMALADDAATGRFRVDTLVETTGLNIASFAENAQGELFALHYGARETPVYRLEGQGGAASDLPELLSQTGCVDPGNAQNPAASLVPFEVNAELWSDGASKRRFVAIPDNTTIAVADDGSFTLPIGSVLVKDFTFQGRRVETRLLVRHDDGDWAGYTYAWRPDGRDAVLVRGSDRIPVGNTAWDVPSRGDCLTCHTGAAGRVLGFRAAQLFRPGATSDALSQLERAGLFARAVPRDRIVPLVDPKGTADRAARARSYLDANCSSCHRPGGPGRGGIDLRFETPFASQGLCDARPETGDLGIANARHIAPGAPDRSVLLRRMATRGASQMPQLGTRVVDESGTSLVRDWIAGLSTCPPTSLRRTIVFMRRETRPGQTIVIRGGLDHGRARTSLGRTCTAQNFECAIPITHRVRGLGEGDSFLDWYGREASQPASAFGTPLAWTTNAWPADWGPVRRVATDGFGVAPENTFGPHHWMLDVDMDCSRTDGGWFELKAFIAGGEGWEPDVRQPGAPWVTNNHLARCGQGNVFVWGDPSHRTFEIR